MYTEHGTQKGFSMLNDKDSDYQVSEPIREQEAWHLNPFISEAMQAGSSSRV